MLLNIFVNLYSFFCSFFKCRVVNEILLVSSRRCVILNSKRISENFISNDSLRFEFRLCHNFDSRFRFITIRILGLIKTRHEQQTKEAKFSKHFSTCDRKFTSLLN